MKSIDVLVYAFLFDKTTQISQPREYCILSRADTSRGVFLFSVERKMKRMTNKKTVNRTIKSMTENHRQDALELVERVLTEFEDEIEGKAVRSLVEGNPKNYHARGFRTAADYGILPGKTVHLPHIDCLMVKELKQDALKQIKGTLEYDFYRALT